MDDYDLELERMKQLIKTNNAKRVLVQLPDGLKPKAKEIQETLIKEFKDLELFFWLNSNFGACDIPLHVDRLNFDLLIHVGHSQWR